ncbi:MAG: adenylate/guanylate cyclase domain-containing protein, partial [Stellaceae bacterium]
DMTGTITFVNGAALRILRREEKDTLGQSITKVFGEMNAWLLEAIDAVAGTRTEKQLPNSEFYIESADEWVPANLALLPLLDGDGNALGLIFVIENLERERELRRTMSRYLSNEVIDRLIEGSDNALGGRAQTVTILFSDIRNFTAISERLGPAGTVALLNEYFAYMEDVVTNHSGVIDKYIGDAVMALFGSPFPSDRDAVNAVRAAYDMGQVLQMLNGRRGQDGAEPIRIGIGIATGTVVSGNIGSSKRMDFTVIGDAVNLASRIEGLTKLYGAEILICGETRARLGEPMRMRWVDRVRVQGQQQPTEVYEVLEHRAAEWDAGLAKASEAYEAGLAAYLAGDWRAALRNFDTALALRANDKAAVEMIGRCHGFLADPPAQWDGVSNMLHK